MSFNCSQFQPQLRAQNKPLQDQIFQTVFLNDENKSAWTKNEIQPSKISELSELSFISREAQNTDQRRFSVRVDEYHQVRTGWQHFLRLPFLSLLQSHKRHTHFAGAWATLNCHEIAMISGLAAAYSLGARYPQELENDAWAKKTFQGYLSIAYRKWGKSAKKKGGNWPPAPLASNSSKKSSNNTSTATL